METRPIPKLNHVHKLVHVPAVVASYKNSGNAEYWRCEGCGKLFLDKNGKTATTMDEVLIPRLGVDVVKAEKKGNKLSVSLDRERTDELRVIVAQYSADNRFLSAEFKTIPADELVAEMTLPTGEHFIVTVVDSEYVPLSDAYAE